MTLPWWYAFIILALAAWRVYSLIAEDTILDRPRAWALGLTGWKEGQKAPASYREKWALFITCPRCAGFWIGLVWLGAYQLSEKWTLIAAVPFALNAIVIAIDKCLTIGDDK